MDEEVPLRGGGIHPVDKSGRTVRRPVGPWTPAVHQLLRRLEDVGFDGAPRVLGIDDTGREVLTYIEGEEAIMRGGPSCTPTASSTRSDC